MAKTVLIVEDDGAVAQLLLEVLESEGFEVLLADEAEAGLHTFESQSIDLVVTGFDLIEPLRELETGKRSAQRAQRAEDPEAGREVPIVITSGVYRSSVVSQELIRNVDFLDDPTDTDRLIDILHDLFSSAYPAPKSTPSGEHRLLPELKNVHAALLDVPEKGDLIQIPFATVLGKLFRERATGALMLRKASVKKIVYVRDGVPIFVKSNLLAECLGRIMVQERLISQEECDESIKRKKKEKKHQGEILVQMGSISPHNLDFALELQMQTKLYDIFSWLEGRYQFNDRGDYHASQVALPLAPTALIYEGASRAMSNERIARELAKLSETRVVPSGDPTFRYQTLQLDPRADRLIDKMEGGRTIGHLLDAAEFDRADAALLIYALSVTGLLQAADRGVPIAEPISLDESDVQALSTGEINAIAELARVGDEPSELPGNWEHLEALFDASAEEALDPVTEPPANHPIPGPDRWNEPRAALFDVDDDVEEPLEGATEEAFSYDGPDTFQSDPALQQAPRMMTLPREARWQPKLPPPPPPPDSMNDSSDDTPLSDDLRRMVRERLDAQMNKIAEARASERPKAGPITKKFPTRPSATGTYRMRAPPRDLEKDKRLEGDLTERLEIMEGLTYYELLEVADDARIELIRTAYHALARKHDPERVVGQSMSRVVHKKAEQIYLLLTRALNTLTNEVARADYDRRIGISQVKQADLIAADAAFELGAAASLRGDWRAARELFERAVRLNREEGLYLGHLGWAIYRGEEDEEKALELLDRGVERCPRAEELHLFLGQIHEKAGRKAEAIRSYQLALGCNQDSVRALEALKVLDPPSHKRSGLLSRLTLS